MCKCDTQTGNRGWHIIGYHVKICLILYYNTVDISFLNKSIPTPAMNDICTGWEGPRVAGAYHVKHPKDTAKHKCFYNSSRVGSMPLQRNLLYSICYILINLVDKIPEIFYPIRMYYSPLQPWMSILPSSSSSLASGGLRQE